MVESALGVLDANFALAIGIIVLGGIMHGYTGWGGGMVMMPLLSLLFGPVEALAISVIGGILVTVQIYPAALRTAQWRDIGPFSLILLVAAPAGSLTLLNTDPELVRRFIGSAIIAATLVLISGWRYTGQRSTWAGGLFGFSSGYINGFVGIGGPLIALYFLSFPDSANVQRANIAIPAGFTILLILITLVAGGGIGIDTLIRGLLLSPFQIFGGWLGVQLFAAAPQEMFRRFTLVALIVLGLFTVLV